MNDKNPLINLIAVPDFWSRIAPYLGPRSYEDCRRISQTAQEAPVVQSIFEGMLSRIGGCNHAPPRETVRRLIDRSLCFRCGGVGHDEHPSLLMLCHCVTLEGKPLLRALPRDVRQRRERVLWRDRQIYGCRRNVTVVKCPLCAVDRVALLMPSRYSPAPQKEEEPSA